MSAEDRSDWIAGVVLLLVTVLLLSIMPALVPIPMMGLVALVPLIWALCVPFTRLVKRPRLDPSWWECPENILMIASLGSGLSVFLARDLLSSEISAPIVIAALMTFIWSSRWIREQV